MMFGMNQEQVMGLVRQVLLIGGTLAASLGWLSPEKVAGLTATVLSLVGPVFMVASVIWSAITKTQSNLIATAAAQTDVNGVKLVSNVSLNPMAQGTTQIAKDTPNNVSVGPHL